MNRVVLVLGVIVGVCLGHQLHAQPPSARAWSDSTAFVVGDPVPVHVEITHQDNLRFTPLVGDTLGAFHILSRQEIRSSSATSSTVEFTVSAYDSGTTILPPLEFAYSFPNDSTVHTVATNPLIFNVRLVEVDTTQEIKDLKPPLSVPLTVAELSLLLGVIASITIIAFVVYQYRKRKKAEKPEQEYVPPPKQAHIQALEELALLKEKRLWQQGLIKQFYSEATEIIRRYFENRFGFMALEKTTDETMDDLRRFSHAHPVLEQTDRILRRADLVKFAKYQPSIPEHEEMLTIAFEIVDKTKVREILSARSTDETPEKAEAREAANV